MKVTVQARRLPFWVLPVCLTLPTPTDATTIVAVVSKSNGAVIAADSKVTFRGKGGSSTTTCKVIQGQECFFGTMGLISHTGTGFDIRKLGRSACKTKGDLNAKVTAFEKLADQPVKNALGHLRKTDPEMYKLYIKSKDPPIAIVFVGIRDGHPALISKEYFVFNDGAISKRTQKAPEGRIRTGMVVVGVQQGIRAYMKANPDWSKQPSVVFARQLVELEIDYQRRAEQNDEKRLIGPPVSVLIIEKLGVRWEHGYQGVCPAVDENLKLPRF